MSTTDTKPTTAELLAELKRELDDFDRELAQLKRAAQVERPIDRSRRILGLRPLRY